MCILDLPSPFTGFVSLTEINEARHNLSEPPIPPRLCKINHVCEATLQSTICYLCSYRGHIPLLLYTPYFLRSNCLSKGSVVVEFCLRSISKNPFLSSIGHAGRERISKIKEFTYSESQVTGTIILGLIMTGRKCHAHTFIPSPVFLSGPRWVICDYCGYFQVFLILI